MTNQNTTFPYNTPNNLPELSFVAGNAQELSFVVYDSGSSLVDLSGATMTWYLARWGTATSVLTKAGTYSGSGIFVVNLPGANTLTFDGKYVQQYKITTTSGSTYRPSQGVVNITRALA
jgi:hypothetical protein